MLGRSIILGRQIFVPRNGFVKNYHSPGGIPGDVCKRSFFFEYYIIQNVIIILVRVFDFSLQNLPFQMKNIYRLTAWFAVFFGSGLALPFLVLRHQLKKQ